MLVEKRSVLERLGYTIISQSENEVVGHRQKWFWDCCATNLTFVVFVRDVQVLTASIIQEDANRLIVQARSLDPSSLPLGFQKARAVIVVYMSDKVEQDAEVLCSSPQKARFATLFFPVALDRSSNKANYLRSTPIWGGLYFSKLRFLVQQLIDPLNAPQEEPLSYFGIIIGSVFILSLVCIMCMCIASVIPLIFSST